MDVSPSPCYNLLMYRSTKEALLVLGTYVALFALSLLFLYAIGAAIF